MNTISIIGTGSMAAAIGGLAAKGGHTVEVMSRTAANAQALADRIGLGATTGAFGTAPAGEIVILAVPYSAAIDVVKRFGNGLAGKLLVDITNPIKPDGSGFLTPENSFGALEIAEAAPVSAKIVKAFNTQTSEVLTTGIGMDRPLDIFLAGDDKRAKACVSAFIESLGLRPLDTGPLSMAWTLEHACMLWLGLKAHTIHHANFGIGISFPGQMHHRLPS